MEINNRENKNSLPGLKLKKHLLNVSSMSESDIEAVKTIELENNLGAWSLEDYRLEIHREDSVSIVAIYKKEVIGFLLSRLITPNDNLIECEINNLAVKKRWQKEGIGQNLFDDFKKIMKLRRVRSVWLEVRRTNFPAINFYQKNGFKIALERKNFYRFPTENALVMRLDLTNETDLIKEMFVR